MMRRTDRAPLSEKASLANRSPQKRHVKGKTKVYGKRTKTDLDATLDAFSKLQVSPQEVPKLTEKRRSLDVLKKEENFRRAPEYLQPLMVKCNASFLSFEEFASRSLRHLPIGKLGEGSYGDVYGLYNSQPKASDPDTVLKIVPLRPPTGRGSRKHTSVDNLLSEYTISALMDEFPGFLRMRAMFLVDGYYPPPLHRAYLNYERIHGKCYNPDPTDPKNYPADQVWAVLEMEYAGIELEKLEKPTLYEIYDIFWAVTFSLGRAEEQVAFEHRDLHLSNICYEEMRSSSAKRIIQRGNKRADDSDDNQVFFGTSGLRTTIIDFTLSRATLKDGGIVFEDLERMAFEKRTAQSEEEIRQNKAYVRMAEIAHRLSKGRPRKLKWRQFNPASNVAWLSYLLSSLLARTGDLNSDNGGSVLAKRLLSLSAHLKNVTTSDEGWQLGASSLINIALKKKFLSRGDVNAIVERLNSG